MKTKEILISTLENRFKKLHVALVFAEDCGNALAFQAENLIDFEITDEQAIAITDLMNSMKTWTQKFAVLAEKMQVIEAKYYNHLSVNKTKCALIEEIPSYGKNDIPNTFQLSEKLLEIGFYEVEGDPYGTKTRTLTQESIIADIQELRTNVTLCIKALANACYNGIWKDVEPIVFDIYEFEPNADIQKLLQLFNVKY